MTIAFNAGQLITAAQMNLLCPTLAIKASNQVITNSTTLTNDSDILFTLQANVTYALDLNLEVVSSIAGHGINIAYALTGTVVVAARSGLGPVSATTSVNTRATLMNSVSFNSASGLTYMTDNQSSQVWEKLILTGGATGGTIQLQWAQAAAGAATTTTVETGSHAILRPVA